jgi:Cu/Ag efflux protein CusF
MFRFAHIRLGYLAALLALGLATGAGTTMAQTRQPTSPLPADRPATADTMRAGTLEGSVKKVDPGAGTIRVSSGLLGILSTTLKVTSDTQIQVEGRQASLAEVREGAKIKASYESREGKNVATQIEVMPAQEREGQAFAPKSN